MPDIALIGFVFLGLFSPGPNVILLTASGARFGFNATLPHIIGVAVGVGIIAGATGLGIGAILQAAPNLKVLLQITASMWILYMAWRLWWANPAQVNENDKPFTLIEAVLFQWVNPKVWAVALSASAYIVELSPTAQAATLSITFSTINLGVCIFWTSTGHLLSGLLRNPNLWRGFMRIMAICLVVFSGLVFL